MSTTFEVLDLVARWTHVIAAIMWVGNSLLFNWLDRSLVKSSSAGMTEKPVGTIWLLHSGGFYYVEKTLLEGQRMPDRVHWFMWQAYTTMITGSLLLIIVYYAGGRALLEEGIAWAKAHGITRLELYVFADNAPAIALYEALGFGHEGRRKHFVRFGETYVDDLVMARLLDQG